MGVATPSLTGRCIAEALGTFLLVLLGCGSVHAAVLTNAQHGLWQVAIVWGVAVMLAIYVVGGISGAHINPAITIAFAAWGRFPWRDVGPYVLAQLVGAIIAAATLLVLYSPFIADLEKREKVVRGDRHSVITAMCYGEYFPSPGPLAGGKEPYSTEAHDKHDAMVTEPIAFLAELLGTLILGLVVFALTDERNVGAPVAKLAPAFIGLTIAVLISIIAPLTQACFNPARDFGPRLVAYFAGWGSIAIPGPPAMGTGFLTVYILAPILGAFLGGGLYLNVLRPYQPTPEPERTVES
ncbi:MAG: aquaporin family protein [Gemmataceae bacterium]|nr:aquaporin family protein [Gemmataceae bacterium]